MNKTVIHSVIIGINDYLDLDRQSALHNEPFAAGLGSLTSPVTSALAFADWLAADRSHTIPVASQELLISDRPDNPPGAKAPTGDNIMAALESWKEKCNEHDNAIGLFFFTGHGFHAGVREEPWLLPADCLADVQKPLRNVIDLSFAVQIMRRTRAKALCFMTDCCRKDYSGDLPQLLNSQRFGEHGPRQLTRTKGQDNLREAPCVKVFAVPKGKEAKAEPGQQSYFTQAALRALKGMGADRDKDDTSRWAITTRALPEGVVKAFEHERALDAKDIPHIDSKPEGNINKVETLYHFHADHPPIIPISVRCDPPEATEHAHLSVTHRRRPEARFQRSRVPTEGNWHVDVSAGPYTIKATFPENKFSPGEEPETFYPPGGREHIVSVEKNPTT